MKFSKFLCLLFIGFRCFVANAQSPCSSCTVNITANNAATYSLGANQNMCISNGATFSGTVSSISSSSKICITGNSTFSGNINNIPAGAQIYIEAGSQFNPAGLYNIGGTITNNGTVNIGTYLTVNAAFTIINTGTFNFNTGMNMNSAFVVTNSGTINFTSGFQSGNSAATTITNSGTFNIGGYTTLLAGSSINNSGTFTATAQQAYLGVIINNTSGQFTFSGTSNTIGNTSTITNQAYLSLNSFTLSASTMSNSSTGTVIFQSTFTLSNACSFTNDGTANFKNNYQLDNGSTMTNNGNIQMNNGNTYLNTNGVFTNYGYVYVNGQVTIGSTATFKNYCTIVAVNGFTNGASNTQNYGYLIVPSNSDPANSAIVFNTSFYNGSNGWIQGINFTNNSGTVSGSGNFYFSGTTTNHGTFGNNTSPAINFYDATPTPSSPSSGMFDAGFGSTSNTTKNTLTPVTINARATDCNSAVISQGTNTECGSAFNATATTLFKNGSFSTAISNATGNTYTSGVGTTYNFSGGSFISQMDYVSTGSTACPRANLATNGNAFSIVTMGTNSTYTGSGTCSNANQNIFPGDIAYGIGYQSNFMYVAGNALAGQEFLVYQQNITGLTIGKSYTFYFYASNLREVANSGDEPIIRIRINGTDGLPDGTVGFGPYLLDEATTQNSTSLGGWKRIAYNFTATATSVKIKITDAAFSSSGDEWGLTAMGITECKNNDTDGDGVNDRDDVDDDNDGVLDINEYGCTSTSSFTWGILGTPGTQTVNGVTLTPFLRNPFSLSGTTITQTAEHTGNLSNDIKFVCNPNTSSQFADLVLSFNKKVSNLRFEINDIDARNNGANTWEDSIFVYAYKDGVAYTLKSAEYNLGSQVIALANNGFVTNQTNNNLAQTSNNGRVIISISDPIDSVVIRFYDNWTNKKDATIYVSSIDFCSVADTDGDGIADYLDVDSDNDGVPDVIENYGVDTDGDGKIDGSFNATTGLSTRLSSAGLTVQDLDGDGVANYIDLDSDNDGIPDIIEAGGTDSNNDGKVDSFTDTDTDGLHDAIEGATALLKSGSDTSNDGMADSWPNKNADLLGRPNLYDLDSDGDGILDAIESGLVGRTGSNGTVAASNGIVSGTRTNGWANTVIGLALLSLTNSDADVVPNYLDIDSDNDGITDNVEAQSTSSYKVPTDTDSDNDGICDIYETAAQIGVFGGGGLTAFDYDGDAAPDYIDTDTDNDGVPDRNEGDRNNPFVTLTQATINASGDTDGDGLMDVFDNVTITGLSAGNYYKNVTMGNMGANGGFDGPTPSGSKIGLQQSNAAADRDWRNASILPLQIRTVAVSYSSPFANIQWEVSNEIEASNYTIEFSTNGISFTSVQQVAAKNTINANYSIQHNLTGYTSTVVYYRIKQINKNGQYFYTPVYPLRLNTKTNIAVHNNPFTSSIGITYYSVQSADVVLVQLISAEGRKVKTQKFSTTTGVNYFNIQQLNNLSRGIYFIKIDSVGQTHQFQVLKQ